MPRGNAPTDAAELADRFGAGQGRAEELIEAARERYSAELEAVQTRVVDENATALLDKAEVAQAADVKVDQIDSAAVRGDAVVAVVADQDGRTRKVLLKLSAFGIEAEEEEGDSILFSSDAAEEAADAKNLTGERIIALIGVGSGKNGSITTKDVKAAAEANASS